MAHPPAAGAAGRCGPQRRTLTPGQEPGLEQAPQRRREAPSVEAFGCNVLQASLAHILRGKHDGQQSPGVAGQPRLRVGAVIGRHRSGDVVSATQVDGHSSGVPRLCQGRAGRSRAHAPRGKKKRLPNGHDVGETGVLRVQSVPRPLAGCSWPAFTGGLWHFWVLGSAAPSVTRRNRHRVSLRACQTASRRSKGQVRPGRVAGWIGRWRVNADCRLSWRVPSAPAPAA